MFFCDDEELKIIVNSKFKLLYFLLRPTFKRFAYLLICVLIYGVIEEYISFDLRYLSVIIPVAMYIVWFIINLINTKKEVEKEEHIFYETKCYSNKPVREIPYSNIRICKLRRTILDRIFGLGKIILITNRSINSWDRIEIPYIENSEDVFKQITKLLDSTEEENNVVKMDFSPKFIWGHQIIGAISFAIIYAYTIYMIESAAPLDFYIKLFFVMLAVSLIKVLIQSVRYSKVKYEFLDTKIKYTGTFTNIELKYKDIKKIKIKQGFLGKKFGLGKIYLYTDSLHSRGKGGGMEELLVAITIPNVTNVEEKAKMIELIIKEHEY